MNNSHTPDTQDTEWPHRQLEKNILHVIQDNTLTSDTAMELIMGHVSNHYAGYKSPEEVERVQQNAVAWAIGVIDEFHMLPHEDTKVDRDKFYKGVKNGLRDRYHSETGIDPAPNYPVKAQLTAQKGEGDDNS